MESKQKSLPRAARALSHYRPPPGMHKKRLLVVHGCLETELKALLASVVVPGHRHLVRCEPPLAHQRMHRKEATGQEHTHTHTNTYTQTHTHTRRSVLDNALASLGNWFWGVKVSNRSSKTWKVQSVANVQACANPSSLNLPGQAAMKATSCETAHIACRWLVSCTSHIISDFMEGKFSKPVWSKFRSLGEFWNHSCCPL